MNIGYALQLIPTGLCIHHLLSFGSVFRLSERAISVNSLILSPMELQVERELALYELLTHYGSKVMLK